MDTSRWDRLTSWIITSAGTLGPVEYRQVAGSGIGLFATGDLAPRETITAIPAQILLNVLTVGSLYPEGLMPLQDYHLVNQSAVLNSTQALSLHVAFTKHDGHTAFSDYIATLPTNFHEHPLTWLSSPGDEPAKTLLGVLPESVKTVLEAVGNRFRKDWQTVHAAIASIPQFAAWLSVDRTDDFLWGWLIVNTRCIHYSLDPDNPRRSLLDFDLTLGPMIDFANHTTIESLSCKVSRDPDGSLKLLAPSAGLKKGEEVLLRYGAHSNTALFTEYGFVIPRDLDGDGADDGGEVVVDDVMNALFQETENFTWIKSVLQNRGYWNDWSLYTHPPPAYPSFRLIPALRLLNLSLPSNLPPPDKAFEAAGDDGTMNSLVKWEATLLGLATMISEQNEQAVRDSVGSLCLHVLERSQEGLSRLPIIMAHMKDLPPWASYALRCINSLWQEEVAVSRAVLRSLQNGLELA